MWSVRLDLSESNSGVLLFPLQPQSWQFYVPLYPYMLFPHASSFSHLTSQYVNYIPEDPDVETFLNSWRKIT